MARKKRRQRAPSEGKATMTSRTPATRAGKGRTFPFVTGAAVLALIGIAIVATWPENATDEPTIDVRIPDLTEAATLGASAFEASCARCHGAYAGGTSVGPPLVHKIYEPSHHGNLAFRRAAQRGVRQHHWNFGAMPRIDVGSRELDNIVRFVRELQQANGIR